MSFYVVTSACFDCKYTDCVEVCPVDCFYEGERMLYINPDECINCDACVPQCPVEAIYNVDLVPEDEKGFIALNKEMSQKLNDDGTNICPVITEMKEPLAKKDE